MQCVRAREIKHAHKPQQAVEREAALGETEAELQGEMEARAAFADAAMEAMLQADANGAVLYDQVHPLRVSRPLVSFPSVGGCARVSARASVSVYTRGCA